MRKVLWFLLVLVILAGVAGIAGGGFTLWYIARGLPDYQQLADYHPPILTRVHAGDGRILAEYATERRVYVPVSAVPKRVIDAFVSAEDKNFYSHPGISLPDIIRAAAVNLLNYGQNKRPVGASTITQQVAKNFLLTNEVSITRKIREAMLALYIERALPKDKILELYLNEIYLGSGAYGVAAAALYYFDKSLDELSVAEAAFLAALPKAPNNYNPTRNPEAAKGRRDYVISRMQEDGAIAEAEAQAARATPISLRTRTDIVLVRADYFAEEVRRELFARFGEDRLYRGGLSVHTTLDPRLEAAAERALRDALQAYDRRHGFRGPLGRIDAGQGWRDRLAGLSKVPGLAPWQPAVILGLTQSVAEIGFSDSSRGQIPFSEMQWARKPLEDQRVGPTPKQPSDALALGDVVAVERLDQTAEGGRALYALRQIPAVSGAIVALDPHTGRVLAMAGGWSFEISQFNRAVQALRQPGSSFKPFVYLPALDSGFTPVSIVLDGPVVIDQGPGVGLWKPSNYSRNYLGPVPMRVGIEQSRNLMTVRLAENIGMEKVVDYAKRFGIVDNMAPQLSMALGAGETTLMRLATAYAMVVNGGHKITPTLIDRIQDRNGTTVFRHDKRACDGCRVERFEDETPPELPDTRARVIEASTAYQMVSMLQGVVERGTAIRLRELKRPLAGKTGTTNDSNDTWFIGFSPDLVAGVFIGFDTPRTLGDRETGSSVALPAFKEFIEEALKDQPAIPFRIPPGIRLLRVNPATGELVRASDRGAIWEAFKPGTETSPRGPLVDAGGGAAGLTSPIPASDGGGLY